MRAEKRSQLQKRKSMDIDKMESQKSGIPQMSFPRPASPAIMNHPNSQMNNQSLAVRQFVTETQNPNTINQN